MSEKKEEKICVSHMLLPTKDPNKKISEKQISNAVIKLENDLKKNPNLFGIAAVHLSSDVATTVQNPQLANCINSAKAKNEDEKKEKAIKCMENYGGNLGCPPKNILDKNFVKAAEKLQEGEIGYVKTQFGHHIIKKNKQLP